MEDDATGHRYGNFPNYYSFNPPNKRLNVLKRSGVLDYILRGLTEESTPSGHTVDCSAAAGKGSRKKPRLEEGTSKESPDNDKNSVGFLTYCDLGCNEGDLTLAMAAILSCGKIKVESADGNHQSLDKNLQQKVKCLGLDIDPTLIERANSKYCNRYNTLDSTGDAEQSKAVVYKNIQTAFKTANLCNATEHNAAVSTFAASLKPRMSKDINIEQQEDKDGDSATPSQVFDVTTIFSTTMWIHVHGGDDGLKSFLQRACGSTRKFLVVEPQPSGCYRKANARLRKMGLQELGDITSARLKLRPSIEEEIDKIINCAGFERVLHMKPPSHSQTSQEEDSNPNERTEWNRAIFLYQRRADDP